MRTLLRKSMGVFGRIIGFVGCVCDLNRPFAGSKLGPLVQACSMHIVIFSSSGKQQDKQLCACSV